MTMDYIQLPVNGLDPAFQQRWAQVHRAEELYGRDSTHWRGLVAGPWVTKHPFTPNVGTHCPHGHSHNAEVVGPVSHADRPHVRRQCRHCTDWWLEPLP